MPEYVTAAAGAATVTPPNGAISPAKDAESPAETQIIAISPTDFAAGGLSLARVALRNAHPDVLHVRLAPGADYLTVTPTEAALGPDERQIVSIVTDTARARASVHGGAAPGATVHLWYQRLGTHDSAGASTPPRQSDIHVHLPIASCPSCGKSLDALVADGQGMPEVCPYCYERLRPCPVCGAPNSWRARRCILDAAHIIRTGLDWGVLGGGPGHDGVRTGEHALPTLSRRWSYPSVAPARRENALTWSAPQTAYGMVAAAAATAFGDAAIYAFDARTGAPLYDPYPLPTPIYPDRGALAIAAGRLFAATIEGTCICLDALRGTRLWQTNVGGRVFGAVTIAAAEPGQPVPLLVAVALKDGTGNLTLLDAETGALLRTAPLPATPDTAPAFADGRAFLHTDDGTISAIEVATGSLLWTAHGAAGFDASPIVLGDAVYSCDTAGTVRRYNTATGEEIWQLAVTSSPLAGTPACDGELLYLPADDGLHLVAAERGQSVRRYPLRQPVRSSPIVVGGTLFFGATDGVLYGALPGHGLERLYETASAGAQIVAAPAYADRTLYAVATNGVLYALAVGMGDDDRAR